MTNSVLDFVESERREEFRQFCETGEATEEFMDHLDKCPNCNAAMEEAFRAINKDFEELAEELHKSCPGPCPENCLLNPKKESLRWFWTGLFIGLALYCLFKVL